MHVCLSAEGFRNTYWHPVSKSTMREDDLALTTQQSLRRLQRCVEVQGRAHQQGPSAGPVFSPQEAAQCLGWSPRLLWHGFPLGTRVQMPVRAPPVWELQERKLQKKQGTRSARCSAGANISLNSWKQPSQGQRRILKWDFFFIRELWISRFRDQ